jgi:hypothetical protein
MSIIILRIDKYHIEMNDDGGTRAITNERITNK